MQGNELGQMRMNLEHPRDQQRAFGRCHLGDVKRIDDVEVKLDRLRRLVVRQLEDTQRGTPSDRITITEMSGQALDRRGDELLERGGACLGLGGFAGTAAQVARGTACGLELYW